MLAIGFISLCASVVLAVPMQPVATPAQIPRFQYSKPEYQVYQFQKKDLKPLSLDDQRKKASSHMMNALKITDRKQYRDADGTLHWYCSPSIDGILVANAGANVNVDKLGRVSSFASSWVSPTHQLYKRDVDPSNSISVVEAFKIFSQAMNLTLFDDITVSKVGNQTILSGCSFCTGNVTASIKYYKTNTTLEKAHDLSIPMRQHFYNAFISIEEGRILALSDWTSKSLFDSPTAKERMAHSTPTRIASTEMKRLKRRMSAFQLVDTQAPTLRRSRMNIKKRQLGQGNRDYIYNTVPVNAGDFLQGRRRVVNPADVSASPLGWHNIGDGQGDQPTTIGNNVFAQENSANSADAVATGQRPIKQDFNFDFAIDDEQLQPSQYRDASTTNLFYVVNSVHDILYKYGFDEASGNFQMNNFDKGGLGNDPIIANSQDGSGMNNANFATPPDGSPGRMRMYLFDSRTQGRDGSLANDVIMHEAMHGVSSRLTGGPSNANCLQAPLSAGMDEGWSDFLAIALSTLPSDNRNTDRTIGVYALNNHAGIRRFPYSTDLQKNPLKYSDLNDPKNQEPHNLGEIWMSFLYEMYWNLIDKHGFTPKFKDDFDSGKGNTLALQLVIDGLKGQPCNPTLLQARDAILSADQQRHRGENVCEIMKGFAKRGLGVGATEDFVDNFDLPQGC